jgi:hypothetical protein
MKQRVLIIWLTIVVLCLSGCNGKEKKRCKENVNSFLSKYQKSDPTCGSFLSSENDDEIKFEGYQKIFAQSITYKIKKVNIDKEKKTVEVIINNIDFRTVCNNLFEDLEKNSNLDSKDVDLLLEKELTLEDVPMKEYTVLFLLDENDKIQLTSEVSNALLGGYPEYIYNLTTGEENK